MDAGNGVRRGRRPDDLGPGLDANREPAGRAQRDSAVGLGRAGVERPEPDALRDSGERKDAFEASQVLSQALVGSVAEGQVREPRGAAPLEPPSTQLASRSTPSASSAKPRHLNTRSAAPCV